MIAAPEIRVSSRLLGTRGLATRYRRTWDLIDERTRCLVMASMAIGQARECLEHAQRPEAEKVDVPAGELRSPLMFLSAVRWLAMAEEYRELARRELAERLAFNEVARAFARGETVAGHAFGEPKGFADVEPVTGRGRS